MCKNEFCVTKEERHFKDLGCQVQFVLTLKGYSVFVIIKTRAYKKKDIPYMCKFGSCTTSVRRLPFFETSLFIFSSLRSFV